MYTAQRTTKGLMNGVFQKKAHHRNEMTLKRCLNVNTKISFVSVLFIFPRKEVLLLSGVGNKGFVLETMSDLL